MQTWVTLKKGTKWALQLDGLISRIYPAYDIRPLVMLNSFACYSANLDRRREHDRYQ